MFYVKPLSGKQLNQFNQNITHVYMYWFYFKNEHELKSCVNVFRLLNGTCYIFPWKENTNHLMYLFLP
jgi:hypothetical protein